VLPPLFGEPHQVARAVKPHDVAKAASGKLQAVSALAAAQVENLAVWLDLGGRYDEVDLTARVLAILDHVTVGLHIEGVEELPPPLLREVCLEVRYGTQARTRCQSSRALGPCRHHHGGQLSSSLPPAAAAGERQTSHRLRPSAGRHETRRPRQNAILSLSIFPVKLLSVDDEAFLQAPTLLGAHHHVHCLRPRTAMKKPSVP